MPDPTEPIPTPQTPLQAPLDLSAYVQQFGAQLITVASASLATWMMSKGVNEDTAVGLAASLCGLIGAYLWGHYQRVHLRNMPAPTQTVVTAVLPPGEVKIEGDGGATIRKIAPLLLIVLLLAGCASDPRQRLADADRAITLAADTLTAAIESGVLDEHPDVIKAGRAGISEASALAAKAHATTQPDRKAFWADETWKAIPRVTAYIAQAIKEAQK